MSASSQYGYHISKHLPQLPGTTAVKEPDPSPRSVIGEETPLMLPVARSDGVEVQEREGELIVGVPDLGERYVLPALATWVWRHADGKTSTSEMVSRVESDLLIQTDEETIRCVLDSLAEAHLLTERTLPPAAARQNLMWREGLRAGLSPDTVGVFTSSCPTVARAQVIGGGEDRQKEEARKQEEGDKQRQREFQEKDAKRQDEWRRQEQENKRNEQEGKRRV